MKTVKLCFFAGTDNINATSYYIKIIESGIKEAGYNIERVFDADNNNITDNDIIVTFFAHNSRHNKKQKIINWFQGIVPEEIFYLKHNLRGFLRMKQWNYFER